MADNYGLLCKTQSFTAISWSTATLWVV